MVRTTGYIDSLLCTVWASCLQPCACHQAVELGTNKSMHSEMGPVWQNRGNPWLQVWWSDGL